MVFDFFIIFWDFCGANFSGVWLNFNGLDYFIENLRFDLVMMMNDVGCMNLNLIFCCCGVLLFDLRDFEHCVVIV